jgi:predicted nucleic acid-binding protein
MKYLIDTNIYGLSFSQTHPQLRQFLTSLDVNDYAVSCFVIAELKAFELKIMCVDFLELVSELTCVPERIIWFNQKQLEIFAALKSYMSSQKIHNSTIDWFIAAQCLAGDYTLVTANTKDYKDIPNLKTKFYDQKNSHWV